MAKTSFDNTYQETVFGTPDVYIDPKKKDIEYHQGWAEYIYSLYVKDGTGFSYSDAESYSLLRAYGRGAQPKSLYMDRASVGFSTANEPTLSSSDIDSDIVDSMQSNRSGWKNVDFKIVSPMPNIKTVIQGMMTEVDWDIFADCVDTRHDNQKKLAKWRAYAEAKESKWMNEVRRARGLEQQESQFQPDNIQEIEEFEASGGFRPNVVRVMEKLLKKTYDISDWEELVKVKAIEDLIDINKCCIKEYYDTEECRYKVKYVDPENAIVQYSKDFDYRNSDFSGDLEKYTISQLRAIGVPEEVLKSVAKKYISNYGNDVNNLGWDYFDYNNGNGRYRYDNFKVLVLNAEWVDIDTSKIRKHTTKRKRTIYSDVDWNYKPKNVKENQVINLRKRQLRKASWIIGGDYCFNWGKVNNVNRPEKSKVQGSYHMIELTGQSITHNLVPYLDQFMLAWVRFQNSAAQALPKTVAIDVSMLNNVYNSKNEAGFLDLIDFMRDTGILPYKLSMTGQYAGGNVTPIQELGGGIGTALEEYINTIGVLKQQMETTAGINSIMMGQTPEARTGKAVTEYSLQSASNGLKPLITQLFAVKKYTAESLSRRIPLAIQGSDQVAQAYEVIIGKSDIDLIKTGIVEEIVYNLDFHERPSTQLKSDILGIIQLAIQKANAGQVDGIPPMVAIDLFDMLDGGGSLREIKERVKYEMTKYNKELERRELQRMEAQSKGQQEQQQLAAQIEQAKIKMETEATMAIEQMKAQFEKELEILKANAEYEGKLEDAANKETLTQMQIDAKQQENESKA